mgnify:CR=1 FL=1
MDYLGFLYTQFNSPYSLLLYYCSVAKEMPYNKSVDSYSFGILLHEILTAEKPFHGYSCGKHMSLVVIGGERPKMDSTRTAFWPLNLQWIMKRCWSPFPEMRPDFHAIRKTLLDVLEDRENTHMADVSHSSVASTEDASTAHLNGTTTATTTHSKHGKSSPLMNPIGALLRSKRSSSKGKDSASPYNPVKAQGPAATGKRTSPWGWAFRK